VAAGALRDALGDAGLGLAGFADARAAAASAASLMASGRLEADEAVLPVLVAFTTSSVTKSFLALTLGGRAFPGRVGGGLTVVVAAAWAGRLLA